jgi:hypothetical protein
MKLKWYHFIACFFAGMFLANSLPHFINGVSGDPFPSPFANPPGKGLSSPVLNVIWGLFNACIGILLFWTGKVSQSKWGFFVFFVGFTFMSLMLAATFSQKMHP